MNLTRKWDVYLIHHSHTDIGYTERQDKLTRYHVDFIKQAIDILNEIHKEENHPAKGFVWQCENHWQIKNFYKNADKAYIADFEKYVKSGEIGLSGNYLNMTDLVSADILNSRIKQAREYGDKIGVKIDSGMAADVNGFSWGYSEALFDNGVENFFSCLHSHHGMFPLYKKFMPFYWETPKGNKILVWNGEQYHYGNELLFAPHAASTYMTYDKIGADMKKDIVFKENNEETEKKELEILDERLGRLLENLEKDGYPSDMIPFMVSGCITDNAPPSAEIAKRVNKLNEIYNGKISFKMVTLTQFFSELKNRFKDIPTYRGDWNDWWADGVGSTADAVKIFMLGQRKYSLCKKLDTEGSLGKPELMEEAAENLMLYAEHTWGYSSSVSEPWESLVGELDFKKASYAINGNSAAAINLDTILAAKGEVSIKAFKPQEYKVINPHDFDLTATALIFVEFWEYLDGIDFSLDTPFEVYNLKTGEVLKSQIKRIARAFQIEVLVSLKSKEEMEIALRPTRQPKNGCVRIGSMVGAEGVLDISIKGEYPKFAQCIETDYFKLKFSEAYGLVSLIDKKTNKDLIAEDSEFAPFSGIYEVTDIKETACEERRRMGRNRKMPKTRRYESFLTDMHIVEHGDVYTAIELDYELEGTKFYSVFIKVYNDLPSINAMVRIHKESVWEPENLYIALPFTLGSDETKYIDKTGCIIRPGIDQLPGSNKEFYLLQNGVVLEDGTRSLMVACKDAPLVTFGNLEAKVIELCDSKDEDFNKETTFSWVLNNFWETNFKVDLGGFYEFAYSISVSDKITTEQAFKVLEAGNEGLIAFYI